MGGIMFKNEKFKGILYLVISSSAFGVMPIITKFVYAQGVSTYSLLFYRFLFAGIILSIYTIFKRVSLKVSLKGFLIISIVSILGYALTAVTLFSSYKYISVGLATMILYTYPAIVTILDSIIYKNKMDRKKLISLIMCFIGLCFLVFNKSANLNVTGIILAFLSAIFFSIYVIGVSHKYVKDINNYVMTEYISFIAGLFIFLIGFSYGDINLKINFVSFVYIVALSLISTVIALITFINGVKIVGPSKAAILSTLEPIVSLILGIIILNESFTFNTALGSLFVVIGVIILSK